MKVHFKHWRNECPAWIQHRTITVVNFSGHVERPGSARTVVFEGRLPSCRLPWIPRPARWCEKHRNKSDSKWSESRFNVLGLVLSGSQVVYISYTSIPRWANFHLLRATRVAPKQLPNIPWIPYHELPHLVNIFIFKIFSPSHVDASAASWVSRNVVRPWPLDFGIAANLLRSSPSVERKVAKKVPCSCFWCHMMLSNRHKSWPVMTGGEGRSWEACRPWQVQSQAGFTYIIYLQFP